MQTETLKKRLALILVVSDDIYVNALSLNGDISAILGSHQSSYCILVDNIVMEKFTEMDFGQEVNIMEKLCVFTREKDLGYSAALGRPIEYAGKHYPRLLTNRGSLPLRDIVCSYVEASTDRSVTPIQLLHPNLELQLRRI